MKEVHFHPAGTRGLLSVTVDGRLALRRDIEELCRVLNADPEAQELAREALSMVVHDAEFMEGPPKPPQLRIFRPPLVDKNDDADRSCGEERVHGRVSRADDPHSVDTEAEEALHRLIHDADGS